MNYKDLMYDWIEIPPTDGEKIFFAKHRQLVKFNFNQHTVCFVRLEGEIHAIHNICPHAGAQLHLGHCNQSGIITCPLHHYKFDVKSGRAADGSGYHLKKYSFKKSGDAYFLGIKK